MGLRRPYWEDLALLVQALMARRMQLPGSEAHGTLLGSFLALSLPGWASNSISVICGFVRVFNFIGVCGVFRFRFQVRRCLVIFS